MAGSVPDGDEVAARRPGPLLRLFRDQRIAFLFVGAANTGIGFLLFTAFDLTLGQVLRLQIGAAWTSVVTLACAHLVASPIAFVLHRTLVFRVRGHVVRDFFRFQSVYVVTLSINFFVLPLLVLIGVPTLLAQAGFTVVTVIISWFGHKYFSFRRPRANAGDDGVDDIERGVL